MGPTSVLWVPGGPHVGPMNLPIKDAGPTASSVPTTKLGRHISFEFFHLSVILHNVKLNCIISGGFAWCFKLNIFFPLMKAFIKLWWLHNLYSTKLHSSLTCYFIAIDYLRTNVQSVLLAISKPAMIQYIPRNMHTVLLCFALLRLCNRS